MSAKQSVKSESGLTWVDHKRQTGYFLDMCCIPEEKFSSYLAKAIFFAWIVGYADWVCVS